MNNPHIKEDWFTYELDNPDYLWDYWYESGIEVEVGGLGLIICSLCVTAVNSVNIGFRIVDENGIPLQPYRTNTGNRHPTHFSFEPNPQSLENLKIITFHIIANCQRAKLQFRPSDGTASNQPGWFELNDYVHSTSKDRPWCHKTISTMTAIPLIPIYQPGKNTIFTYPQSRMPRSTVDETPSKSSHSKVTITSSP